MPRKAALPFAINLVASVIVTPIQFGPHNPPLAAVEMTIVWSTIFWMTIAFWKHYRWLAAAQAPHFARLSLSTVPQLSITAINWEKGL